MVAALNWETIPTKITAIDLGTTLADNTMSAAGAVISNHTGLDMLFWLELTTSDSTALFDTTPPDDANPAAVIYRTLAINGTTYEGAPLTGGADQSGKFVASIPLEKNTTTSRIIVGPYLFPPSLQKYYLDCQNGAGTLTAEWELNLWYNNPETQ